jgi:hypothetical protein
MRGGVVYYWWWRRTRGGCQTVGTLGLEKERERRVRIRGRERGTTNEIFCQRERLTCGGGWLVVAERKRKKIYI